MSSSSSRHPFLLTPTRRLQVLAHTRRMGLVLLPLGAGIGLLVALALRALGSFEPWVGRMGGTLHLGILLPALGLFFATMLLQITGIGDESPTRRNFALIQVWHF